MLHEPPAATVVQVLVSAKNAEPVPDNATPLTVSAAPPVFATVTVRADEMLPAGVPGKLSDDGDTAASGPGTGVPVPVSAIVCGDPVALSEIDTVEARVATDCGLNATVIVQ